MSYYYSADLDNIAESNALFVVSNNNENATSTVINGKAMAKRLAGALWRSVVHETVECNDWIRNATLNAYFPHTLLYDNGYEENIAVVENIDLKPKHFDPKRWHQHARGLLESMITISPVPNNPSQYQVLWGDINDATYRNIVEYRDGMFYLVPSE